MTTASAGYGTQSLAAHVQFLVADDHGFVRHIVGEVLKSHGVKRVTFAEDGEQALRSLKSPQQAADASAGNPATHANCVISDFKMGDVNGLHVLKAIRCGDTRVPRDTPVILLTGASDDFIAAVALQLDVNAFVLKPVSHKVLWERIERVLKSAGKAKDLGLYRKIEIPSEAEGVVSPEKDPVAEAEDKEKDKDQESRCLPLNAVAPGAILARDLFGASGALLLREGVVLSPTVLQTLMDLEQMKVLVAPVPIR